MKKSPSMVTLAQEYLAYRRKLGFQLNIEGEQTLRFAEYADQTGHDGPITTELALRWARLPENAAPLYQARRLEVVRCFARHRAIFDTDTEIPPERLLGPAHQRIQPHIYSHQEICAIMEAAGRLTPTGGLRPRTYTALFGTLICTGLRISEALRMLRGDVDLERGWLTIKESKFHKSRQLVLHSSTVEKLGQYARFRDSYCSLPGSEAFFLSERGSPLPYSTVRHTFRSICDQLGLKSAGRPRPRMYDFRHTFACRHLLKCYHDRVDVDHAMLALSTYLGHTRVTDTYWYITGIPDLMHIAAERFEQYVHSNRKEGLQ